jgi:hypothetical protein
MAPQKSIDRKTAQNDAIPALTAWTFVRAAALANTLVAALVFVEFCAFELVNHDGTAFLLGLSLVPILTLVIWSTSALLCAMALTPRWLRNLGRRLIGTSRSLPSRTSGVWDDWLDGSELHHP